MAYTKPQLEQLSTLTLENLMIQNPTDELLVQEILKSRRSAHPREFKLTVSPRVTDGLNTPAKEREFQKKLDAKRNSIRASEDGESVELGNEPELPVEVEVVAKRGRGRPRKNV